MIGSVPSARIASTCSDTTIEPSSAAIAEPTRPASMSEASTGPISRTSEVITSCPVLAVAPKVLSVGAVLSARMPPVNAPVNTMIRIDPTPIRSICVIISRK